MLPARYGLAGPALDPKNYTQSESWEIGDMVWLKIYDKRLGLIIIIIIIIIIINLTASGLSPGGSDYNAYT